MVRSNDEMLLVLLDYVKRQRGVDFTAYKQSSLKRRIERRLHVLGLDSFGAYFDQLQASPDEINALLDSAFINVTQFFRDPEAWDAMRTTVIPQIVAAKTDGAPVRVWCAGVASGEEAYTIAMLLAEAMPLPEFRERVKIFSTDLDDGALKQARHGSYTEKQVEAVPPELREKYFERDDDRYTFRADLRRCVIFGKHNLLDDAPISRLDLLSCRNTLMYFNREAQTRILMRFHFALRDEGFLFLGKAEMMLTRRQLFTPVHAKARIFSKVTQLSLRDRISLLEPPEPELTGSLIEHVHLRDVAFDTSTLAHLVIDASGRLVLANESARLQFGLEERDLMRPFSELEVSYRPVELRSVIEQVLKERRAITVSDVERSTSRGRAHFDVKVSPLPDGSNGMLGVSIVFTDVSAAHDLRKQLEHSKSELETAYEELQSTNEELETTNEELQSTIEELETTNEELQSTNEELETMNEELQSTNDEIRAINDQLHDRGAEVGRLNTYLRSIVDSVGQGVVVLDRDLHVRVWNTHATELWGVREDEAKGRAFLNLDIGIPLEELRDSLRRVLRADGGPQALVVASHNRRGRPFSCRVQLTPLQDGDSERNGVILTMEEWSGSGDGNREGDGAS